MTKWKVTALIAAAIMIVGGAFLYLQLSYPKEKNHKITAAGGKKKQTPPKKQKDEAKKEAPGETAQGPAFVFSTVEHIIYKYEN